MSKETFDENFWENALEKVNIDPRKMFGTLRVQHKPTGKIFLSDINVGICFNVFDGIPPLEGVMLQEADGNQLLRAGVRVFSEMVDPTFVFNVALITDDGREVWHYLRERDHEKKPGVYSHSSFPYDVASQKPGKTDYRVIFFSSDFSYSQSLR